MFDTVPPTDRNATPEFDIEVMMALLSCLDDEELRAIEDDLDFYHFSGSPPPRLRALLKRASRQRSAA